MHFKHLALWLRLQALSYRFTRNLNSQLTELFEIRDRFFAKNLRYCERRARDSTVKANPANLFRAILSRAMLLSRARCYHPPSWVARRHHAEITQPNVGF